MPPASAYSTSEGACFLSPIVDNIAPSQQAGGARIHGATPRQASVRGATLQQASEGDAHGATSQASGSGGHDAMSQQPSGNGTPSQQPSWDGMPSQQGSGIGSPSQGGGRGAPSQGGGSSAPLQQGGDDTITGTHAPIPPLWPADTDLVFQPGTNKITLMTQQPLVRIVIQDGIENVRAHLMSSHAFPDLAATLPIVRAALLHAATSHFPSTFHVHRRLQSDEDYVGPISCLVCSSCLRDDTIDTFHRYVFGFHFFGVKSKSSALQLSLQTFLLLAHQVRLDSLLKDNDQITTIFSPLHQM